SVTRTRFANGGNTMSQPEFIHIFWSSSLGTTACMRMVVEETWKCEHPFSFNNFVVGTSLRATVLIYRDSGVTNSVHRDNSISLDHDIDRAHCRRSSAVDKIHTSDNKAIKRPFPFCSIGCIRHLCV